MESTPRIPSGFTASPFDFGGLDSDQLQELNAWDPTDPESVAALMADVDEVISGLLPSAELTEPTNELDFLESAMMDESERPEEPSAPQDEPPAEDFDFSAPTLEDDSLFSREPTPAPEDPTSAPEHPCKSPPMDFVEVTTSEAAALMQDLAADANDASSLSSEAPTTTHFTGPFNSIPMPGSAFVFGNTVHINSTGSALPPIPAPGPTPFYEPTYLATMYNVPATTSQVPPTLPQNSYTFVTEASAETGPFIINDRKGKRKAEPQDDVEGLSRAKRQCYAPNFSEHRPGPVSDPFNSQAAYPSIFMHPQTNPYPQGYNPLPTQQQQEWPAHPQVQGWNGFPMGMTQQYPQPYPQFHPGYFGHQQMLPGQYGMPVQTAHNPMGAHPPMPQAMPYPAPPSAAPIQSTNTAPRPRGRPRKPRKTSRATASNTAQAPNSVQQPAVPSPSSSGSNSDVSSGVPTQTGGNAGDGNTLRLPPHDPEKFRAWFGPWMSKLS